MLSGYVEKDHTWSLKSGKESRLYQYRLSDNYLRFYLKNIEPNKNKIAKEQITNLSLTRLPGWESMMGLQFENLILRNRHHIHKKLHIDPSDIVYDNPFFQRKTTRQSGCQIDYLIQTRFQTLYLCEIKFSRNKVSSKIIEEVKKKKIRLKVPKGFSILPVLIHVNGYSPIIEEKDFFLEIIDFSEFLNIEPEQ